MQRNNKNKTFIPSRTSPKGSSRACLCWDTNTYSIDCCDGSMRAQGIGVITRTATIEEDDFLLQENEDFLLQEDSLKIIV
tara:strand:+ start:553 stop:792 length:240 start_codon:yes stop_codon:yes gene_type:complete